MEDILLILGRDPRLAALIKKHGLPDLKRGRNPFQALIRSIIYQQVSGRAAQSIHKRFLALYQGKAPTPVQIQKTTIKRLRSAGLSGQKAIYIKDLADKFLDGTLQPRRFPRMSNEEIIEHLVQVKGIGVWTAHMFLIFTLNRPDVLPVGDLAIRKGFQIVYNLRKLPDNKRMEQLAKPWRKHASTASWYLWRAADERKGVVYKM